MKTILTALALAALTSAALADGAVELTDAQMDKVTAGVRQNGIPPGQAQKASKARSVAVPDTLKRSTKDVTPGQFKGGSGGNDGNARITVDGRTLRQGGNGGNTRVGNVLAVY